MTPVLRRSRQTGITLVELMVAMAVGLVVSAIGLALMATTLRGNADNLRYIKIDQDLRMAMNAITHDIARARYWGLADDVVRASQAADLSISATTGSVTIAAYEKGTTNVASVFATPFTDSNLSGRTLVLYIAGGTTVRYDLTDVARTSNSVITATVPTGTTLPQTSIPGGNWTLLNPFSTVSVNVPSGGTAGTCILLTYDLNENGLLDSSGDGAERYGYRLNTTNGSIDTTRSATSCTAGTWEALTNERAIEITTFSVTPIVQTVTGSHGVNLRMSAYQIVLTGRLRADTSVTRTLRETVKVRNDEIF